ncbi:hypothetical protein LWI29_007081 [Acer saccharum]|uniref:Uncharacterized protein n=1 Tax=Acer saccharum TaxID=4024 RepID=A0AA39VMJ3_ACESA|nr:hypothetical protein LWI29_007081 [Acer saccharum]
MDKTDVAKNSAGKVAVGNSIRPRLGLYQGNRKIGGSRFEILSEDLEENVGTNNYISRSPKHNKPVPNKILSDISNRGKISGGQSINHSKKVLEVNKSRGNKSFKEVYKEVGFGVSGKVHNKGSHSGKLVVNHQVGMEEELEDSDVLQALHQDMLNSEVVVKGTEESNMIAVGESILEDGLEQVDVPGATNFDEVASKLKEAMEIAMGQLFSNSSRSRALLVGAECEDDRIELLLSQVSGKDIIELIASGRGELASVPSGGGVAVAMAASGGGGGATPAAAESKKEESDDDMAYILFD